MSSIELASNNQHTIPIPFLEIAPFSSDTCSVTSTMTDTSSESNNTTDNEQTTASTTENAGGSVLSVATNGKTKWLWNGVETFTVDDVYRKNVVEQPTKDELRTLNNVIKKHVFPKLKFIPNWEDCVVLTHDKEKDTAEQTGWTHSVFNKMSWKSDEYFQPFQQAIKWNTYKHEFKLHFNRVRANIITNLKKHMLSGKSKLRIFFLITSI